MGLQCQFADIELIVLPLCSTLKYLEKRGMGWVVMQSLTDIYECHKG